MARVQLKDSGVLFDEEQHTYLLNDKYLSGITGMLQRQFFPDEFEGIPKATLDAAAQYGTDCHSDIEDFDTSWINSGSVEVQDYIQICRENNLTHECSEYTVTDGENWASRVDKVYRVSDDTFDLGDNKNLWENDCREAGEGEMAVVNLRCVHRAYEQKGEGQEPICHPSSQQAEEGWYMGSYL